MIYRQLTFIERPSPIGIDQCKDALLQRVIAGSFTGHAKVCFNFAHLTTADLSTRFCLDLKSFPFFSSLYKRIT